MAYKPKCNHFKWSNSYKWSDDLNCYKLKINKSRAGESKSWVALIDDADYSDIIRRRWRIDYHGKVCSWQNAFGEDDFVQLHRYIADPKPSTLLVTFRNKDIYDCRRANLFFRRNKKTLFIDRVDRRKGVFIQRKEVDLNVWYVLIQTPRKVVATAQCPTLAEAVTVRDMLRSYDRRQRLAYLIDYETNRAFKSPLHHTRKAGNRFVVDYFRNYIGCFPTVEAAVKARNKYIVTTAKKLFRS